MKEPVLIVSDLHLGHAASRIERVEQLRPLLSGAATVVFNGDTWQELAASWRERSEAQLEELKQLCAELGAEAVFLPGNHDPGWPGRGWVELAEGRIVITHGDAVLWAGSPWSREYFQREDRIRELWDEHRAAEDDAGVRLVLARKIALALKPPSLPKGRSFFRRVSDALKPPRRAVEILRVWLAQAEAVAYFAAKYFPRAEVMLIGHFHRGGVWLKRGTMVVNTGTFADPNGAMWAEFAGGKLTVGKVVAKDGAFHRGPARSAGETWFDSAS